MFMNSEFKSDIQTKISYFILGYSNFVRGQRIKGLLWFAGEIAYLFFMLFWGIPAIRGMITLGEAEQGWVFDDKLGINVRTEGDNSMLLLLYGVAVILLTAAFVLYYLAAVKSAKEAQMIEHRGKRLPTFAEDARSLLDGKFYITLLVLPVAGVVLFTILPLVYMILIAFTNYDSNHQPPGKLFDWVGFSNFKAMLFEGTTLSRSFFPILFWTLTWAVLATATSYIFGILAALLINKKGIKFKGLWRTVLVTTIAIPQFVSLLIMRNMLNDYGIINELLLKWGIISERIGFLTDSTLAKIVVLVVNLWVGIPYTMLITTGILLNIPQEQYEAAMVDGANKFVVFTKITLPQIFFVTTPYLITQFIGNINNFNIIYLLTDGGPLNSNYYYAGSTDLLVTWLYKLTANQRDYNIASTIGILVFIISAVISLITYSKSKAYKEEGGYQ